MNDQEIELMMSEMKLAGCSDADIGYAVSKEIYGEESPLPILLMFQEGVKWVESSQSGDEFVAGSRKFLEEQLKRFE